MHSPVFKIITYEFFPFFLIRSYDFPNTTKLKQEVNMYTHCFNVNNLFVVNKNIFSFLQKQICLNLLIKENGNDIIMRTTISEEPGMVKMLYLKPCFFCSWIWLAYNLSMHCVIEATLNNLWHQTLWSGSVVKQERRKINCWFMIKRSNIHFLWFQNLYTDFRS